MVRRVRLVRREPVDLRLVVHGVPEVQARAGFEVAWLEAAFEQQDRAAPAERAYAFGLGQVEQRETVGACQAGVDALDAMAVRIRLHDRPHLGARGGGARALQVVGERGRVDQGFDGARHAPNFDSAPRPTTNPLVPNSGLTRRTSRGSGGGGATATMPAMSARPLCSDSLPPRE